MKKPALLSDTALLKDIFVATDRYIRFATHPDKFSDEGKTRYRGVCGEANKELDLERSTWIQFGLWNMRVDQVLMESGERFIIPKELPPPPPSVTPPPPVEKKMPKVPPQPPKEPPPRGRGSERDDGSAC